MKKPPKELPSRVRERKKDDQYETVASGNMAPIREGFKGKRFSESFSETKLDRNSRIDADVTMHSKKRAVPTDQWEMIVNATPQGIPDDPAGAFLPMPGRIRPVPHKKTNECDY